MRKKSIKSHHLECWILITIYFLLLYDYRKKGERRVSLRLWEMGVVDGLWVSPRIWLGIKDDVIRQCQEDQPSIGRRRSAREKNRVEKSESLEERFLGNETVLRSWFWVGGDKSYERKKRGWMPSIHFYYYPGIIIYIKVKAGSSVLHIYIYMERDVWLCVLPGFLGEGKARWMSR